MGCTESILNPSVNHIIVKTRDEYYVYVYMGDKCKILCKSNDMEHCKRMLAKFYKDPGGFSFRNYG